MEPSVEELRLRLGPEPKQDAAASVRPDVPSATRAVSAGGGEEAARRSEPSFLARHAEIYLISVLLLVVAAVFHWIPYKLAFLNFFYLPVLAAGYWLGARRAVQMSLLCTLLVVLYFFWLWTRYAVAGGLAYHEVWRVAIQDLVTLSGLAMWGGFLILTGSSFGYAHEKMLTNYAQAQELNRQLQARAEELRRVNAELESSTTALERRAGELLEKNLTIERLKQQVEETLYSTMDSTVARLVIQGRLHDEKRRLSVLFCDLEGFTSYAQARRPEVVVDDLNQFYRSLDTLIEAYHGHIDKYMGDGIMAEFGAPIEYEQHFLQGVVAALKIQEKTREMKLPWKMRIGLASGDAVAGLLGGRRRSYSVIGAAVNLAKRLEEICEPGAVYMDEETTQAVSHLVEVERISTFGKRRAEDIAVLEQIAAKEKQLGMDPGNAELIFHVGQQYLRIREATRALNYFHRAMELDPENREYKLAYADASLKQDQFEKISIPGLRDRHAVYQALRLKDPLQHRERFPERFFERYHRFQHRVEIPDDAVLPTEAIDGTVGHSMAVSVLAGALADHLGFPEELQRNLLLAGRLQDLGKAVIWHHILNRRVSLSEFERKELEGHVQESMNIARRMGYDSPAVLEIISNHHELMNGSGYPRRLKAADISMGARIACVADVYCALTAWRPYREPWDRQAALSELRKGVVAEKYDAVAVDALCELLS